MVRDLAADRLGTRARPAAQRATVAPAFAAQRQPGVEPNPTGRPEGLQAGIASLSGQEPHRLLLQVLLLAQTVGIALYAWHCRVRHIGRRDQMALWAGGFLILAVAPLLLHCDPALALLRDGNYLLYALILVLFWGSVFATFKPRVGVP
jgi:hypothetical protein